MVREPIEMPFGMLTHVGPRKYVLDGVRSDKSIRDARDDSEPGIVGRISPPGACCLHRQ